MKTTLNYILALIITFAVPMLTSWLLDLEWIALHWTRQWLIYLLMFVELSLGILMLRQLILNNKTPTR